MKDVLSMETAHFIEENTFTETDLLRTVDNLDVSGADEEATITGPIPCLPEFLASLYCGFLTDVTVWICHAIKRVYRRLMISSKYAIEHEVDEFRILGSDYNGCRSTDRMDTKNTHPGIRGDSVHSVEEEEVQFLEHEKIIYCDKCGRPYRRKYALDRHRTNCIGKLLDLLTITREIGVVV